MKRLSFLFFILLIIWISVASYWYVCKIRCHCGEDIQKTGASGNDSLSQKENQKQDSLTLSYDFLKKYGAKKYYFDFGSYRLTPGNDDAAYLSWLKYYLIHKSGASVNVVGHSDNKGSVSGKDKCASLRANSLKAYLINNGIREDMINSSSKSDTEPVAGNDTPEGRKSNRRAEIIIN